MELSVRKFEAFTEINALELPCFKDAELGFMVEYSQILKPIATGVDRYQFYYGNRLTTLFSI